MRSVDLAAAKASRSEFNSSPNTANDVGTGGSSKSVVAPLGWTSGWASCARPERAAVRAASSAARTICATDSDESADAADAVTVPAAPSLMATTYQENDRATPLV